MVNGRARAPPAVGDAVEVEKFAGSYYNATVQEVADGKAMVHYEGFADSWNQWVSYDKLKGFSHSAAEEQQPKTTAVADPPLRDAPAQRPASTARSATLGSDRRELLSVHRANETPDEREQAADKSNHPAWRESGRAGWSSGSTERTTTSLRVDAKVDRRVDELERVAGSLAEERSSNFELLKELEVMDWAYFPKALPTLSPTPMKAYTVRPRSRTVCIAGRASGAF